MPLHLKTVAKMDILYRVCLTATMECVRLLGVTEHGDGDEDEEEEDRLLLRVLTPICKLFTAKCAVFCASEGIESVGGIAYLETMPMARIWRDAQVLPVWEGTTNVLSLDALRAIQTGNALNVYLERVRNVILLDIEQNGALNREFECLERFLFEYAGKRSLCELYGRDIAYSLFRVYAAALMYEHAHFTKKPLDLEAYRQFVRGDIQSSFVGGDCGKCLVSQSIRNLVEGDVEEIGRAHV